jgi:hypothetical protein
LETCLLDEGQASGEKPDEWPQFFSSGPCIHAAAPPVEKQLKSSSATRIADSSSRKAVSFSSACTTNCFPLSRCASAIQIVRPLEPIAETQPKLQPALLRSSAMISQPGRELRNFADARACQDGWRSERQNRDRQRTPHSDNRGAAIYFIRQLRRHQDAL